MWKTLAIVKSGRAPKRGYALWLRQNRGQEMFQKEIDSEHSGSWRLAGSAWEWTRSLMKQLQL